MLASIFVRWIQRQRLQGGRTVHWRAILAQAVRVGGMPRQQHVAYLGGITKADAAKNVERRVEFWDTATTKLDEVKLGSAERRKVEAALAARVPRPSREERARCHRAQLRAQ